MKTRQSIPHNVEEYLSQFSGPIRDRLDTIRHVIRTTAPAAEETISYQMPAYKLHGMLVFFAAFTNHIGLFPSPAAIEAFRTELNTYPLSKGTIQFPHNRELPVELISKIVAFKVELNLQKSKTGKKK